MIACGTSVERWLFSQSISKDLNKALEKFGMPQLQHIHDASDRASWEKTVLERPTQSLWYHISHESQAITGIYEIVNTPLNRGAVGAFSCFTNTSLFLFKIFLAITLWLEVCFAFFCQ